MAEAQAQAATDADATLALERLELALARRDETSLATPDALVAARLRTLAAIARRVTVTPRRPLEVDLPVARLPAP